MDGHIIIQHFVLINILAQQGHYQHLSYSKIVITTQKYMVAERCWQQKTPDAKKPPTTMLPWKE